MSTGFGSANSPLPRSVWSLARSGFLQMLRADPALRAFGVKFSHFGPEKADIPGDQVINSTQLPVVRVTSAGSPLSEWRTEGMHNTPLEMSVEIGVNSLDEGLFLDLWGSIVRAAFPEQGTPERTVADRLMSEAQVEQITLVDVPVPEIDGSSLVGRGRFRLDLYISTNA